MSEGTARHGASLHPLRGKTALVAGGGCARAIRLAADDAAAATIGRACRAGGGPGVVAHGASQGAVMTTTRGLARELGPDIRVTSVCQGMIDTDVHTIFTKPEVRANVAQATPLKREGKTENVASLVACFASDAAAFVTRPNIDINGGLTFC